MLPKRSLQQFASLEPCTFTTTAAKFERRLVTYSVAIFREFNPEANDDEKEPTKRKWLHAYFEEREHQDPGNPFADESFEDIVDFESITNTPSRYRGIAKIHLGTIVVAPFPRTHTAPFDETAVARIHGSLNPFELPTFATFLHDPEPLKLLETIPFRDVDMNYTTQACLDFLKAQISYGFVKSARMGLENKQIKLQPLLSELIFQPQFRYFKSFMSLSERIVVGPEFVDQLFKQWVWYRESFPAMTIEIYCEDQEHLQSHMKFLCWDAQKVVYGRRLVTEHGMVCVINNNGLCSLRFIKNFRNFGIIPSTREYCF
ncbi:hypothetical protein QR680_014873 [Steinernema hermaphroditum]|uniref:Uncharacterized protein n=1 Tax=Steinernema hermaphroditum TaxID=289476 RepID=A0AA39M3Y7_9BILA|nr:hypothetical protein QR680_014873 [Steinernema hermaphroditum]